MLTEENLRVLGKTSKEIQEEALLDRMKTISELLAKVDTALEDATSTATGPPGTAASTRPSSTRPATGQRLPTAERPLATGQRLPTATRPGSSAEPPPRTAGSVASQDARGPPQTITLAELQQQDRLADSHIELVTYTGTQSHIAGISSRRKVHARAQRSEMGSLLSWSGD